ncbi:hypothetical protein L249_5007 [Ophiocordyceps polyrhachis-furcata BCC 54312]|uniref:Reverse transcriptase Ty1/copia-type domain-containing protein n=1 Tax=Ophiocordyceps polyrhachis-furcata BCC 54312 TaxID=1330021 RepID=A0A367L374_9HYPO|nr:hypothetical protein L249_5007 [Ophiocordyceps polyrhachis-furcata BCC 54312]
MSVDQMVLKPSCRLTKPEDWTNWWNDLVDTAEDFEVWEFIDPERDDVLIEPEKPAAPSEARTTRSGSLDGPSHASLYEGYKDILLPRYENKLSLSGGASWNEEVKVMRLRRSLSSELRQYCIGRDIPQNDYAFNPEVVGLQTDDTLLLGTRAFTEGFFAILQDTVTTSSTEAEFLALSHVVKEVRAFSRLCSEMHFKPGQDVRIQCDNKQTIRLVTDETPKLKTRLLHVDIHHHWLRQEVQSGLSDLGPLPRINTSLVLKTFPTECWASIDGPDDVRFARSDTGFSNAEMSLEWVHYFNKVSWDRTAIDIVDRDHHEKTARGPFLAAAAAFLAKAPAAAFLG